MKCLSKNSLTFLWLLVNVGALLSIAIVYLAFYRSGAGNFFSAEQAHAFARSASKEQLAELFLEQGAAIRGVLSAMFLILHIWLGLTLLNVLVTFGYWYGQKQKAALK